MPSPSTGRLPNSPLNPHSAEPTRKHAPRRGSERSADIRFVAHNEQVGRRAVIESAKSRHHPHALRIDSCHKLRYTRQQKAPAFSITSRLIPAITPISTVERTCWEVRLVRSRHQCKKSRPVSPAGTLLIKPRSKQPYRTTSISLGRQVLVKNGSSWAVEAQGRVPAFYREQVSLVQLPRSRSPRGWYGPKYTVVRAVGASALAAGDRITLAARAAGKRCGVSSIELLMVVVKGERTRSLSSGMSFERRRPCRSCCRRSTAPWNPVIARRYCEPMPGTLAWPLRA